MEGFKKQPKMQCFKEGGSVKYESRKEHKEEMEADIKQDKAIVKKAIAMHDKQEHKGEKTDLSKLKKGGRAKKEAGSVRKYKTGGTVEVAYGAKKTAKDIKDIANTKRQKPALLCGGGKAMKKYSGKDGSSVNAKLKDLEEQRNLEKMARAKKYLGPAQQSELIKQSPAAAGLTSPGINAGAGNTAAGSQDAAIPGGMKKGGKACK